MKKKKKAAAFSTLDFIVREQLHLLPEKDLKVLLVEVENRLVPETADFDEVDWENVSRLQADGINRLEALQRARHERNEAIEGGEIDE